MQVGKIGEGTGVHQVVQLGEADVVLDAEFAAALVQSRRRRGDLLSVFRGRVVGPRVSRENRCRRITKVPLYRRSLLPGPRIMCVRQYCAHREVVVEREDHVCVARNRSSVLPCEQHSLAVGTHCDEAGEWCYRLPKSYTRLTKLPPPK